LGSVNEYQLRLGRQKAGMAHSDYGWTCGCAGKTVKSLENMCHTWALLRWWFTMKRRYIKCMYLYLYQGRSFTWCTGAISTRCPSCRHQWHIRVPAGVEPRLVRLVQNKPGSSHRCMSQCYLNHCSLH